MPHTEDLAIFARVVELGSLSAAGRDLRLSPAVVSNRIARLEGDLNARLLNRTTRRVNPTEEGAAFYQHCLSILNELEQVENLLSQRTDEPRGPIKVSLPVAFGRRYVAPHMGAFLARYPQMQVRLQLTDRFSDLIQERIDLAIRVGVLEDSSAIVRNLATDRRVIVAAPAYLEARGTPQTPEDLLEHNCLLLRFPGSKQYRWTLNTPDGPQLLRVAGNMDSDNSEVLLDWCLAGHGLALKSVWEIVDYLNEGQLKIVLSGYPPVSDAIHALYPHGAHVPTRVRAFIDFLVEIFGPKPVWERELKARI
ncbi:LysR family transcriptional regulator [Dongia sp.]|uniref:LysR family transcriptional regulator n=1 Tax=Dongia sp. TaxID=1977262 RepID=UPI0035AEE205